MYKIRKLHVYDAIIVLSKIKTKAALYILKTVKQTLNHAKHKGWDQDRMYIHLGICGKQKRFKMLRFCAKAKSKLMRRDICQVRVTMQYKGIKELYAEMIAGQCSPAFAHIIKNKMVSNNDDYEKVRKN